MKNIFLLVLCILCFTINAQNTKVCGKLSFTQVTNLSILHQAHYQMTFNETASFYEEVFIDPSETKKEQDVTSEGGTNMTTNTTYIGRKNLTSQFHYNNQKDFFFREIFMNEAIVAKEDSHKWGWKLSLETKNIGSFTCQKATIDFRGRTYTAWFTQEIPVPYGPWKFRGLPGLILEVYDVDNVFHITANDISISDNENCQIAMDLHQTKNALSIPEYLEKKNEIFDAEMAKLASRMPKGTKMPKLNSSCEDCNKTIEKF